MTAMRAAGAGEGSRAATALSSMAAALRAASVGAISGAVAGVIAGGVGGRIVTRITAITAGDAKQGAITEANEVVGVISVNGTMGLIFFSGFLAGMFGGLVYAAMRPWITAAGPWRGLALGSILLATLGWTVIERDNFDFHRFGYATLNIAMFAALFVIFGLLVAPLYDFFDDRLQPVSLRPSGIAGLAARALVGLAVLATAVELVVSADGRDGMERVFTLLLPAYLLFAMPLAAAATARAAVGFERMTDLYRYPAAMTIAAVAIAIPIVIGGVLDVRAITHILGEA